MEMTKVQLENHLAGLEKEREFATQRGNTKQASAVTAEIGRTKKALGQAPDEEPGDVAPATASSQVETTSAEPPGTTAKPAPRKRTAARRKRS